MEKSKISKIIFFSLIFLAVIVIIAFKFKRIKNIYKGAGIKFSQQKKQEIKTKLSKLFFFNIHGKKLGRIAKRFLVKYKPGGVILLSSNVKNVKALKKFIQNIRKVYNDNPDENPLTPLIAIDQEGGRVRRIKKEIPQFPSAKKVAQRGADYVKQSARKTNSALKQIGINVNFSPVGDVLTNKLNKVIGDRAFSGNEKIVSKMVESYLKGAIPTGIITCVKHFPGHGNVSVDSHKSLPVDNTPIEKLNIEPFITAIKNNVHMIMTVHILYPEIDNVPATISKKILSIIREKHAYDGVIISDDLSMGALKKNFDTAEVVVKSIKAGVDMFIHTAIKYSDHIKLLNKTTEILTKDIKALVAMEKAYQRVIKMKNRVLEKYYK